MLPFLDGKQAPRAGVKPSGAMILPVADIDCTTESFFAS